MTSLLENLISSSGNITAMTSRIDGVTDMIAQDLSAFVDPGTEPSFEADGNMLSVQWQVQGKKRDAMFTLRAGSRLSWASGPSGDDPYYAFLASDDLAGFSQLARSCVAKIDEQGDFVASEALLEEGQDRESILLTPNALSDLIGVSRGQAEEGSATRLLFVKGDAGAGKTTLLQQTTRLQATRYLAGESQFLCLYVPAQGRELSNLRDAFAGELGELRAAFSHDAIACLAREGVLVPVIDGFDELLGTAGYGGAFSSLQTLVGELEGYGTLVVSARSAFYDVEFGRANGRRPDTAMTLSTAEIQPWSDDQLTEYLTRHREGRDPDLTAELARLDPSDRELLRRPFFASQFEEFVRRAGGDVESGLLEHLIDAYIEREAGKIVDAHGEPVLDADGHRYLFELAVGEMWENGVRQLSENDLRTIALLVAEASDLDAGQAIQLETKVTSYAGFRPRRGTHSSQSSFAFEHEVYFDHFLGCALGRLTRESRLDELVRFLDRGVIPETVAGASVKRLGDKQALDPSLLRCPSGVNFENRRRNLGSIVLAYARDARPVSDATIHGLSFVDVWSEGVQMERVRFESCQFIDADLRGARFKDCDADSSDFDGITLDDSSQLGIAGLLPGLNVKRIHYEPAGYVYAPAAIGALLERLGAPVPDKPEDQPAYSEHAQELIAVLERVARAYQRTTILYETDDRRHHAILGSPRWAELKALLIEHGVISAEEREAKGANVTAYRLRANPDELLTGDLADGHSSTAGLWKALRSV
jgi:NACHT domain/Pentapeptide repeats (8 copies)